jgi:cell division transport system permease protein
LSNGKHASYFYAIFGIALVLFVLGVAGVMLIEAQRWSSQFRENLKIEVILADSVSNAKVHEMQQVLSNKHYIKNLEYVSKEQAVALLQKDKDVKENFLDILGYNPLYASFILNLHQGYANKDSFEVIKSDISALPGVSKVSIQTNILESLDKNIRNASLIVLVIAVAFLIFAVSLIFNTIRLAMFSSRFTIKTMQLFGATRWFIIRPFLGRSILNGFLGGLIACLLIGGLIFYFNRALPELGLQGDLISFAILSGGVVLFGIVISFSSTLTAVLRYLRVRIEDLY